LHRIEFRTFDGIASGGGGGCFCCTIPRDGVGKSRGLLCSLYAYDPFAAGLACVITIRPVATRPRIVIGVGDIILVCIYFSLCARASMSVCPRKASTCKRCLGYFCSCFSCFLFFFIAIPRAADGVSVLYFNLLRFVVYII